MALSPERKRPNWLGVTGDQDSPPAAVLQGACRSTTRGPIPKAIQRNPTNDRQRKLLHLTVTGGVLALAALG